VDWIYQNKHWLFSGFATALLTTIIGFFLKSKGPSQKQKSGSHSHNVQVGGNYTVEKDEKKTP